MHIGNIEELDRIVEQKIAALFHEMDAAGWRAADVAQSIRKDLDLRSRPQAEDLRKARAAVGGDFVSDGNEG
nr:hypothetical protein [uncultured Gellertiella sp.]